jgi:hypothetical protein
VFNLNVTEQDSALDIALAYAEYGLSVVPLHRHNKVPTKELGGWQKFQERQPTTEELEKWFKGRDDVVVALVCGKFIVVDIIITIQKTLRLGWQDVLRDMILPS